ncbi:uncharacterized protein LOC115745210 [Rhodamnia argentea]|uniref:Uncharacterized protein LOC115745210 n=1 Tax=Rhodamnia argentea TaxID=178133 RepID=A0A8B8PNZ4_9MYRT|nr:uncharacterized protein LOC115745210 [Rhodamnia argentea]
MGGTNKPCQPHPCCHFKSPFLPAFTPPPFFNGPWHWHSPFNSSSFVLTMFLHICARSNMLPIAGSSQIVRPQSSVSPTFEAVESSIGGLVRSWSRRRKWRLFFGPGESRGTNTADPSIAAWRTRVGKFLDSNFAHIFSIFLLLADTIITSFELSSSLTNASLKPRTDSRETWYHWVGIAILSLLSAKTFALVVASGRSFFRRPGYVVDGLVAVGALFLEAFLEKKGGGLIAVVSLWRILRVVEGAFELSDEAIEAQVELILNEFESLRQENQRLREAADQMNERIEQLEDDIAQCVHACN